MRMFGDRQIGTAAIVPLKTVMRNKEERPSGLLAARRGMGYLWVRSSTAQSAPPGGSRMSGEVFSITRTRPPDRRRGGEWTADGEPPVPMQRSYPPAPRPVTSRAGFAGTLFLMMPVLAVLEGCGGGGGHSQAPPSGNEVNGVASEVRTRDLGS